MKTYVTETLELEPETYERLQEIAKQHNATIDEVINEILLDKLSTRITVKELKEKLDDNIEEFTDFFTIINKEEKPIARVTPL